MKKTLCLLLLTLTLLLGGCATRQEAVEAPALLEPVGVQADTAVATLGNMYSVSIAEGSIVAESQELCFEIDGEIDLVNIYPGKWVEEGELLLSLDQSAMEKEIRSLREEISYAETNGAYDDEVARIDIALLEIAKSMPGNQRKKVCFVLFDLEEAGLIGSASYRKAHKAQTDRQMVLNLDCVGDGDYLTLFPTKRLKKDRKRLTSLYKACGYFGKKSILVHEKGFSFYPSDQANFPWGVGICALNKRGKTLYLSRIHTKKDTILERTNVNLLRAALITYICRDAAQKERK